MLHNRAHDDHGVSRKILSLRHVPRSSTSWTPCNMLWGQILHKFHVERVKKYQRTREYVSLWHVPETRPGNIFTGVQSLRFAPCYMSLLHIPATCPLSVYLTILSLLHFAATYSCNKTPRVGPPLKLPDIVKGCAWLTRITSSKLFVLSVTRTDDKSQLDFYWEVDFSQSANVKEMYLPIAYKSFFEGRGKAGLRQA